MERVCNDHTPIIITRKSESPVVMMSLKELGNGGNKIAVYFIGGTLVQPAGRSLILLLEGLIGTI